MERVYQKKTIQEVVELTGVAHGQLSELETGVKDHITIRMLQKLSRFYGREILHWALKDRLVDNGEMLETLKLLRVLEDKDSE